MKYGYARVSAADQKLDTQIDMLKAAGCQKIFCEKRSGKNGDRIEFRKLLKAVKRGDEIVVSRLDRAMRNMREMLNTLHDLNERGVGFLSLKEEWANLRSSSGKLLLHILSAVAEFELDLRIELRALVRVNGS